MGGHGLVPTTVFVLIRVPLKNNYSPGGYLLLLLELKESAIALQHYVSGVGPQDYAGGYGRLLTTFGLVFLRLAGGCLRGTFATPFDSSLAS